MSAAKKKPKGELICEYRYAEDGYCRYYASRVPHSNCIVLNDDGEEILIHTEALHDLVQALYQFAKRADVRDRELIAKRKKKRAA